MSVSPFTLIVMLQSDFSFAQMGRTQEVTNFIEPLGVRAGTNRFSKALSPNPTFEWKVVQGKKVLP
jgi:hypothetical protein